MAISRVKPANWGIGEKLTSAQQNQLDTNVTYSLDKRAGQTDTLESVVTCSGAGRIIGTLATGANADTTYLASGANSIIRVTSAVTASRIYTLGATNANTGDRIHIYVDPTLPAAYSITVKDQAAATLFVLGNHSFYQGRWASFIYAGGWQLFEADGPRYGVEEFTANGNWTAPPGVTQVILIGCGGGGGGGGGLSAQAADTHTSGGGGGAGAIRGVSNYTVTPGSTYAIAIGSGGTGGIVGGNGAAGTATSFDAAVFFTGGEGGLAGKVSALGPTGMTWGLGGRAGRGGTQPVAMDVDNMGDFYRQCAAQQGGAGVTGNNATYKQSGLDGPHASGGAAGTPDATSSGSFRGGGCGGGGGAGGFGAGGAGGNGGTPSNAGAASTGVTNGAAAAANTGGGGGGGGSAGNTTAGTLGGTGGNGGSGKLIILY